MADQVDQATTETTKTTLENSVTWFLADRLQDPNATIVTKKYLTTNNVLVYLTRCNMAETNVPSAKVQVFRRVERGVQETGYLLFADHRFVKYTNEMIFGTQPGTAAGNKMQDVTEAEAQTVLTLVNSLANARQTL